MFAEEDLKEADDTPSLGPAYFDARRVAQQVMAKFEAEHFKPIIDKISEEVSDRLQSDLDSYLLSNAEMNMQSEIWRMVDNCTKALLAGDRWALELYVLGHRYDCDKIREAVARHIPAELQDRRIADLEGELDRVKRDLRFYRDR